MTILNALGAWLLFSLSLYGLVPPWRGFGGDSWLSVPAVGVAGLICRSARGFPSILSISGTVRLSTDPPFVRR